MIPTTAVFDASVFARAFIDGDDGATAWVADASAYRLAVHVPELVFAEVANALVTHARVRGAAPDAVVARVKSLSLLPLRVERLVHLAPLPLGWRSRTASPRTTRATWHLPRRATRRSSPPTAGSQPPRLALTSSSSAYGRGARSSSEICRYSIAAALSFGRPAASFIAIRWSSDAKRIG